MLELQSGTRGMVISLSEGGDRKVFTKEAALTASVARLTGATVCKLREWLFASL